LLIRLPGKFNKQKAVGRVTLPLRRKERGFGEAGFLRIILIRAMRVKKNSGGSCVSRFSPAKRQAVA
jgi:hypothetical protein